jgi:hypothetical protein
LDGRDQRDMYRGAGDGFTRAFELALTPAIFAGFGYVLDGRLGVRPVLTILFFLIAVAGQFVKMYYTYEARMKAHESAGPWASPVARPVEGAEPAA